MKPKLDFSKPLSARQRWNQKSGRKEINAARVVREKQRVIQSWKLVC
jgi:hypothetical protein